jgi:hypothetical protein
VLWRWRTTTDDDERDMLGWGIQERMGGRRDPAWPSRRRLPFGAELGDKDVVVSGCGIVRSRDEPAEMFLCGMAIPSRRALHFLRFVTGG